jgi:hypothetical protein
MLTHHADSFPASGVQIRRRDVSAGVVAGGAVVWHGVLHWRACSAHAFVSQVVAQTYGYGRGKSVCPACFCSALHVASSGCAVSLDGNTLYVARNYAVAKFDLTQAFPIQGNHDFHSNGLYNNWLAVHPTDANIVRAGLSFLLNA